MDGLYTNCERNQTEMWATIGGDAAVGAMATPDTEPLDARYHTTSHRSFTSFAVCSIEVIPQVGRTKLYGLDRSSGGGQIFATQIDTCARVKYGIEAYMPDLSPAQTRLSLFLRLPSHKTSLSTYLSNLPPKHVFFAKCAV